MFFTLLVVILHGKAKHFVMLAMFLPKLSTLSMYGSGQIRSTTMPSLLSMFLYCAKVQPSSSYSILRLTPMHVMSALPVYFGLKNLIILARFSALFLFDLKLASMWIGLGLIFFPSTLAPSISALSDVLISISEDSSPLTLVMSRSAPGPMISFLPLQSSSIVMLFFVISHLRLNCAQLLAVPLLFRSALPPVRCRCFPAPHGCHCKQLCPCCWML